MFFIIPHWISPNEIPNFIENLKFPNFVFWIFYNILVRSNSTNSIIFIESIKMLQRGGRPSTMSINTIFFREKSLNRILRQSRPRKITFSPSYPLLFLPSAPLSSFHSYPIFISASSPAHYWISILLHYRKSYICLSIRYNCLDYAQSLWNRKLPGSSLQAPSPASERIFWCRWRKWPKEMQKWWIFH